MSTTIPADTKKRAICPVCERRGESGWMGDIFYERANPNVWTWYVVAARATSRFASTANQVVGRFTGFTATSENGSFVPTCSKGHRLRRVAPDKITDLIAKADRLGYSSIVRMPE